MTLLRFVCCCLLVHSSWHSVIADESPLLWQFNVGDEHRYRMTQKMNMEMSLGAANRRVATNIEQIVDLTWKIERIDDQGLAKILQTVDRLQMDVQAPGHQEMRYDTDSDKSPAGFAAILVPLLKAMTNEPIVMSISSRGEILSVNIPESIAKAMQAIPGAAMMGELFSDEGFRNMIQQNSLVLPMRADLKPGHEWTRQAVMNNAQLGTIETATNYRYLGPRNVEGEPFEAFDVNMTISLGEGPGGAKFEVTKHESHGEIFFNRAAGRLESSKLQQEFELNVAAGDQITTQKMIQNTIFRRIDKQTE